jgi:hypothetical protein
MIKYFNLYKYLHINIHIFKINNLYNHTASITQ